VANLQQFKNFNGLSLIGRCQHTIRSQDLMVPFEGFEDGLTGRLNAREVAPGERRPLSLTSQAANGVRGTGMAAKLVRSYRRIQRAQLYFGAFLPPLVSQNYCNANRAGAFRFLRQPSRPKQAGIAPLQHRLRAAGAVSQI
jgi:hypothetical protein